MTSTDLDLRYPIGRFTKPATISKDDLVSAIGTLAEFPGQLRNAVDGLDHDHWNTPYREGGWTIRQVVHHVADSHMNASTRVRLALTELAYHQAIRRSSLSRPA